MRTLSWLLIAAVSVGVVFVLLGRQSPAEQGGPLAVTDPVAVEYEYAAGKESTWGSALPETTGSSAVSVTKVEPVGLVGLDVVGIQACDASSASCSIVDSPGWPQPGITTIPVEGLRVWPAGQGPAYALQIGVRRQANAPMGIIEGLKFTYAAGGKQYEVVEPWTLRVYAPGTMPAPSS
jgi:hypothetical protein